MILAGSAKGVIKTFMHIKGGFSPNFTVLELIASGGKFPQNKL